jgi:hypothetical protein
MPVNYLMSRDGQPTRKTAVVKLLISRGHSGRSACRITGLNRSTFHAHRRSPVSDCRVQRIVVASEIEEIHQRSRGTYGKRRVRAVLLDEHEIIVNLKLVSGIMLATRTVIDLVERIESVPGRRALPMHWSNYAQLARIVNAIVRSVGCVLPRRTVSPKSTDCWLGSRRPRSVGWISHLGILGYSPIGDGLSRSGDQATRAR